MVYRTLQEEYLNLEGVGKMGGGESIRIEVPVGLGKRMRRAVSGYVNEKRG